MADDSVRDGFAQASAWFVDVVSQVEPAQLDAPASDAWTVGALIGHGARAFTATETVLGTPVDPSTRALSGAAEYYRVALSHAGVHQGITQRGIDAGTALGDAPLEAVTAAAGRLAPLVAATPLDREVQHLAGRLSFGEYLRTRVAELVLHTVDLELAIGIEPRGTGIAAELTRDLMVELADRADPLLVACALAGRPVPAGCNVLG